MNTMLRFVVQEKSDGKWHVLVTGVSGKEDYRLFDDEFKDREMAANFCRKAVMANSALLVVEHGERLYHTAGEFVSYLSFYSVFDSAYDDYIDNEFEGIAYEDKYYSPCELLSAVDNDEYTKHKRIWCTKEEAEVERRVANLMEKESGASIEVFGVPVVLFKPYHENKQD